MFYINAQNGSLLVLIEISKAKNPMDVTAPEINPSTCLFSYRLLYLLLKALRSYQKKQTITYGILDYRLLKCGSIYS